jgi:hypothetical protein
MRKLIVVPVQHPAFTFRVPEMLGPLEAHVTGFVDRFANGFEPDPKVELNPTVERLCEMITLAVEHELPLSTDVEAKPPDNGPKEWAKLPAFAELRMVGVGIDLPTGRWALNWFWPIRQPRVWELFCQAMANPLIPKLFVNGDAYDIPMLERYGCRFARNSSGLLINVHDLADSRRAISSTSRVGLAAQASWYLRVRPWKAEATEDDAADVKGTINAANIPADRLSFYNGCDTVFAAGAWAKQQRELVPSDPKEAGRIHRLYRQQRRLASVAAGMSINGMPVDEQRRLSLAAELADMGRQRARDLALLLQPHAPVKFVEAGDKADKYRGKFFRITHNGGVNEADLAALLYRDKAKAHIDGFKLEVPMHKDCWTETGQPAVNRKALIKLIELVDPPKEVIAVIRQCWKVDAPIKARVTHVDSWQIKAHIGPYGHVHPSHNPRGTETGRFSCSDPNVYNISEAKHDDEGALQGDLPNLRDIYVAKKCRQCGKKMVIVNGDMRSFELETLQHSSGDVALRQMLDKAAPGDKQWDVHAQRARAFFSIPDNQKVPSQIRRNGKIVGLQSQYHAGLGSVWASVLMQVPDADFREIKAIYERFPKVHTGIAAHWKSSLEFALINGFNETDIMHRRRYYPDGDPPADTETSNYQPQGNAADIANSIMVGVEDADYEKSLDYRIRNQFTHAWLGLHVYDSFAVWCHEEEASAVANMMVETAAGPWTIKDLPREYKMDIKIADRLSGT